MNGREFDAYDVGVYVRARETLDHMGWRVLRCAPKGAVREYRMR